MLYKLNGLQIIMIFKEPIKINHNNITYYKTEYNIFALYISLFEDIIIPISILKM